MSNLEINWLITDACLHLQCRCGEESHFDMPYVDELTCLHCGLRYRLPKLVFAVPIEEE